MSLCNKRNKQETCKKILKEKKNITNIMQRIIISIITI